MQLHHIPPFDPDAASSSPLPHSLVFPPPPSATTFLVLSGKSTTFHASRIRLRRTLSSGGGRGRACCLPRTGRRPRRRLRRGRLHGHAPGAALREVDALVAADGLHARPRDAELRQASGRCRVHHRRAVQRQRKIEECVGITSSLSHVLLYIPDE